MCLMKNVGSIFFNLMWFNPLRYVLTKEILVQWKKCVYAKHYLFSNLIFWFSPLRYVLEMC